MPGRVDAYRRLLHNRTFVLLWGGQTLSGLGDTLFNIAIRWLMYVRTGSALQTGIIGVIYQLSAVVLAPLGGAYADRWDHKRTMLAVSLLSGAIVGAAALPLAAGHFSPLLVYGTVLALCAVSYLYSPAYYSVMPEIVGTDLLATAGGLSSAVGQGTQFIGSALAGLILAVLGAGWALIADAVSFLAVALAISATAFPVKGHGANRRRGVGIVSDLRQGWCTVRGIRWSVPWSSSPPWSTWLRSARSSRLSCACSYMAVRVFTGDWKARSQWAEWWAR